MRNSLRFRRYIWLTVFVVLVIVLIGIPMANGAIDREGLIALALGSLFILYQVLETRALIATPEEELDHPIIGKLAEVVGEFSSVQNGFEGRVLVNGAPWTARSLNHKFYVGDTAEVISIDGQTLQLEFKEGS